MCWWDGVANSERKMVVFVNFSSCITTYMRYISLASYPSYSKQYSVETQASFRLEAHLEIHWRNKGEADIEKVKVAFDDFASLSFTSRKLSKSESEAGFPLNVPSDHRPFTFPYIQNPKLFLFQSLHSSMPVCRLKRGWLEDTLLSLILKTRFLDSPCAYFPIWRNYIQALCDNCHLESFPLFVILSHYFSSVEHEFKLLDFSGPYTVHSSWILTLRPITQLKHSVCLWPT